jgi:hypothetical protein
VNGVRDNGLMGNSRGAGPATPGSLAYLASRTTEEPRIRSGAAYRQMFDVAANAEVTKRLSCYPLLSVVENDSFTLPVFEDDDGVLSFIEN